MTKGWRKESVRHSLASKGISTARKNSPHYAVEEAVLHYLENPDPDSFAHISEKLPGRNQREKELYAMDMAEGLSLASAYQDFKDQTTPREGTKMIVDRSTDYSIHQDYYITDDPIPPPGYRWAYPDEISIVEDPKKLKRVTYIEVEDRSVKM